MFPLGLAHLRAIGLAPALAHTFIVPILSACDRFEIDTAERLSAFLGECQVESQSFTRMEENLRYTTPERIMAMFSAVKTRAQAISLANNPEGLANVVYANRNGNGDEASGDGWRYHGRGPIMTTGLSNYVLAEQGCGSPYVLQPQLLKEPVDGCLASAFFWHSNGLNELADKGDIDGITRRINGKKMVEAELRRQLVAKALKVLQSTPV